jgi:hypothetical protein
MGTLHPLAERAFSWLFQTVKAETGITMSAVSNGDDYRSYEMQHDVFMQRYLPNYNILRTTKADPRIGPDGRVWYKKWGVAAVASPGTSNHGWGLALDVALWVETKPWVWKIMPVTSNPLLFAWLSTPGWIKPDNPWCIGSGTNAESFGLSWEMQTEKWHLRYNAGDFIPQRILDLEAWYAGQAA